MFDLYFAGGQDKMLDDEIFRRKGCRLYSQLNDIKDIDRWMENAVGTNEFGKLFIDSGAYTAKKQGVEVDLDDYITKINRIGDKINCFANLDVIPKINNKAHILEGCEKGWQNFLYIQDKCKYKEKCMFVFHKNEPEEILDRAIEYYKEHTYLTFMALGGLVGEQDNALDFCIKHCLKIKKELPYVKIHLFGYTKLKKLPLIKCDSCDSTTWIMTGANGGIMTDFGTINISDRQQYLKDSIHTQQPEIQKQIIEYVQSHGFTMEGLATDYKQRMLFNIIYLMEWSAKYKYSPYTFTKSSLI